jgi:integrase
MGGKIDASTTIHMQGGDKWVTNQKNNANFPVKSRVPARKKKRGPHILVKFGSATVPVYRSDSGGRIRYVISHYRHGKRLRKSFTTLETAKKEALLVAQQIQSGMQHVTDLKPHEREAFLTARQLSDSAGVPLISALEDYLHARQLAGAESLADDGLENVVDVEVVTPDEFRKIIHAAPMHLIPLLAISAFAGIRSAELGRLDWNAVDLASSSV